jgi:hypothetical protein
MQKNNSLRELSIWQTFGNPYFNNAPAMQPTLSAPTHQKAA